MQVNVIYSIPFDLSCNVLFVKVFIGKMDL
jgi:hypothetical protein